MLGQALVALGLVAEGEEEFWRLALELLAEAGQSRRCSNPNRELQFDTWQ
jgi:hypothetical protein